MNNDIKCFGDLEIGFYFEWYGNGYMKSGERNALKLPEKKTVTIDAKQLVGVPPINKKSITKGRLIEIRDMIDKLINDISIE